MKHEPAGSAVAISVMARIIDHGPSVAWIIRRTSAGATTSKANERMQNERMDLILRGGRVIDPAQGLDATADVGFAVAAWRLSHRGSRSPRRRSATSPDRS
jgi:uncharacterized Ntn-hydrolase superfamily protein